MFSLPKVCQLLALAILVLPPTETLAATPTIDPFTNVIPDVPAGKSLVMPVSVTNPDGGPLTFAVTSSNPVIQARVKTGNPVLRLHVNYEGTPTFSGDLDFQLFRDLAPITSGFISGFAQSGYYDNLIFHRVVKDFVAQGGDPQGTGAGGPGFVFEHEFQPSLIFSGIGQLAMANSAAGFDRGVTSRENSQVPAGEIGLGDFSPTNGSQFFITQSNQHNNLDFKHTIFGQLVRGWSLLAQINNVPTDSSSKPTSNVRIQTAKILPGRSEATILLGSRGVGASTITVTVTDQNGAVTTSSFVATGKRDTVNNRPIMGLLKTENLEINEGPSVSVTAIDLERDRISFGVAGVRPSLTSTQAYIQPTYIGYATISGGLGSFPESGVSTVAIGVSGYLDNSSGNLPQAGFDYTGQPLEFAPYASYSWQVQRFIVGKKPVRTEEVPTAATAATSSSLIVARFSDTDVSGAPGIYSASINWGDGTAVTSGTVARDSTRPGAALFEVSGTHTYARAGIYTATTILNWNVPPNSTAEELTRVRSSVFVIAAGTVLQARGAMLDVSTKTGAVGNRILATFTDTNKTLAARDYVATVDWGDGVLSRAVVVKTSPGAFSVRGVHTYRDAETFALNVRIHPAAATNDTGDAVTWTTLNLSGFKPAPHAPPFPITNIRASWDDLRNGGNPQYSQDLTIQKVVTAGLVDPYVPGNLTVQLRGRISVNNSGDKASAGSAIRGYLSTDPNLDTTGATSDKLLNINGVDQVTVGALAPGAFVSTGTTPWVVSLPKGESGGRKYFITQMVYSDPIIDQSAVPKFTVIPLPARVCQLPQSGTFTTQDGNTKVTFKVVLDTLPASNVTLPVTSSLTTQGAAAPSQLVFTPANYNVPQTVTVTGVQDNNPDAKSYSVTVGPATSSDSLYSGLAGFSIGLTNQP